MEENNNIPELKPNQFYCAKCKKVMRGAMFYQYKDGSKCELCKNCLTMHIDNFDEDTYTWILKKFDVPYIPAEWNKLRDKAYIKNPHKINGLSVIGKYLSKMKLKQWKKYSWADTEKLKKEAEERAKLYGAEEEDKLKNIEQAYKNGEISEAQFLTYKELNQPTVEFKKIDGVITTENPAGAAAGVDTMGIEDVDLPDVGGELTKDDKIYLATKWGQLYSASDWIYLEKKYNDFMNSFDIQGAARIDTLIQICKLSLKCNQALDTGDMDSYSKLARSYDLLMKSAKFTEAQRKEEKGKEFDAVGQIVFFAEKEGGKIPRYDITTPLDIVDKAIQNLKKYNHDLVVNDPSLSQMFENFIKRRENAEEHKKNIQEAEAEGLDHIELKVEDYQKFSDFLSGEEEK